MPSNTRLHTALEVRSIERFPVSPAHCRASRPYGLWLVKPFFHPAEGVHEFAIKYIS